MKTIVFAGGSSLLAQTWIREENNEYKYILGIHKLKNQNNKMVKLMNLIMLISAF